MDVERRVVIGGISSLLPSLPSMTLDEPECRGVSNGLFKIVFSLDMDVTVAPWTSLDDVEGGRDGKVEAMTLQLTEAKQSSSWSKSANDELERALGKDIGEDSSGIWHL
jgi:hypothetical protein